MLDQSVLGSNIDQQMHVVGHNLQFQDLGSALSRDIPDDLLQPNFDPADKHIAPILRAPDDLPLRPLKGEAHAFRRGRAITFHLLKDTGRGRVQYIGSLDFRNYLEAVKMICWWAKAGDIKPITTPAGVWRPMAAASSPFLII